MNLPRSVKNYITLTGIAITIGGTVVFWSLFFLAETGLIPHGSYFGLVLYLIIPIPILIGLLFIPIGMYIANKRRKAGLGDPQLPVVDLNIPRHRNAFLIFSIGTFFVAFFVMFLSYEGYHYTESVEFCGTLCHEVMEPEYTTYLNSAHARVTCVQCHVGAGADFYAKSKLSGLYQVYAVLADVFPRPIETPVQDLRPAQETCEQCHWPGKIFDAREVRLDHYLSDEDNKHWPIHMLVEIGGQSPDYEQHPGSHWHIHPDVLVEYIAVDDKRLDIPWVRMTNKATGKTEIFLAEGSDVSDNGEYEVRTMDCMDCHNRPSHAYNPPYRALNEMMAEGQISTSLPEIKPVAREFLTAEYSTADSAAEAIHTGITEYYADNYPDIDPALVSQAAEALTAYYRKNFFPGMKARWDVYPVHLGHFETPGCYRCHDGLHSSVSGKIIADKCTDCHAIIAQGDEVSADRINGMEFRHPVDIDEAWREMPCYECHSPDNY